MIYRGRVERPLLLTLTGRPLQYPRRYDKSTIECHMYHIHVLRSIKDLHKARRVSRLCVLSGEVWGQQRGPSLYQNIYGAETHTLSCCRQGKNILSQEDVASPEYIDGKLARPLKEIIASSTTTHFPGLKVVSNPGLRKSRRG